LYGYIFRGTQVDFTMSENDACTNDSCSEMTHKAKTAVQK